MHHRVRDVLSTKGDSVLCVGPLTTVIDAVGVMNENRIGSVVVVEDSYPVGIFSERDVLVRIVAAGLDPKQTLIRDVMTARLHTVTLETTIMEALALITQRRCRHIPVMDGNQLVGLVSIGDLTKSIQHDLKQEVRELSNYIGGPYLS